MESVSAIQIAGNNSVNSENNKENFMENNVLDMPFVTQEQKYQFWIASKAEIKRLRSELENKGQELTLLKTPDNFSTTDETFATDLKELASQHASFQEVGDEVVIYKGKDLGAESFIFGFDVKGTPVFNPKNAE